MEKKKSWGVFMVALIMLIYGPLVYYCNALTGGYTILLLIHIPDGIVFLIAGMFILGRKNWARKLAVITSIIMFLLFLYPAIYGFFHPVVFHPGNVFSDHYNFIWRDSIDTHKSLYISLAVGIIYVPLIMYCLFVYYFTRPKVKEQFK